MMKTKSIAYFAGLSVFLWANTALAAGGGFDWSMVVFHTINLALLLFVLVKFGGPTVTAALQTRSENVSRDIVEAKQLQEEAEQTLAEIDEKIAGFERQAEELLADCVAMGEAERDRIVAEANAEAERIKTEAVRVAENEASRARERLEAEIVDQAIESARMIVESKLNESDHHRLVTDYFAQLEQETRA